MFHFIEIGTSVFECFLIHIFFGNWFGTKSIGRRKFLLGITLFLLANIGYTLAPIEPILRSLLAVVCAAVLVLCLYQTSPVMAICGSVVYIGLSVVGEYITMVVMNAMDFDTAQLMQLGRSRAIYIIFSKIVNLLEMLIVGTILGRNRGPLKVQQLLPLIPCQLVSLFICQVLYQTSKSNDELSGTFILVLLGLMYMNAVMIGFITAISVQESLKREKELGEQQFALQRDYYAQVQREQTELHSLWHDINKYLVAMEALVEGEGKNSAQEALDMLRSDFKRIGSTVDVGNQELNVILNHCVQKARNEGIHINLDVSVPPTLSVSAVDLSVIIGNTVDNAIEAKGPVEDTEYSIDIMCRQQNNMLFYSIKNPLCTEVRKKKAGIHGYGLKNVQRCVDKYNGTFTISQDNGFYQVDVLLNTGVV